MLTASPQQTSSSGGEAFGVAVHPDLATVAEVEREFSELRAAGVTDVVLDLRRVTFIDSSGLALLLEQHLRGMIDVFDDVWRG